uniref:Pre-mRNA-splicing factor 38B n=1 Tax=Sciurus vulgaris TaxID=55149 RepID=A0A8D2AEF7_SCIVU
MVNRTVKDAHSIHGTNPQYLVEKIIRTRIYESKYWKEECFGLTAELVVDKAMELSAIYCPPKALNSRFRSLAFIL